MEKEAANDPFLKQIVFPHFLKKLSVDVTLEHETFL